MSEDNYYKENAWKGERPLDPRIVDDPDTVFDGIATPSMDEKTFNRFGLILICILGVSVFFSFVWGVIANGFANGLYWHKMVADTFTFNGLILFFISLFLLMICCYFERRYMWRFVEYTGYSSKASQRFNSTFYTVLNYSDSTSVIPTQILGLMDLVPTVWKQRGFNDKAGKAKFYWDEQVLIGYGYIDTPLSRKIKLANLINWFFIFIGWPLLIGQIITEDVYIPAYITLFFMSALLLVSRIMTKSRGVKRYPQITFNRRNGMVTKLNKGKQEWSCHFRELNAYIHNQRTSQSALYWLTLVPRSPVGIPRYGAQLMDWGHQTPDSCQELWEVIQGFMNITFPLPFVIPLEAVRDKDPTSRNVVAGPELDKFRQLRSLSDNQYQKILKEQIVG